MKCFALQRIPQIARSRFRCKNRVKRETAVRAEPQEDPRWTNLAAETGPQAGSLPYEFDQDELQELADLMPPPLEAQSLPSSKIEIKRLLDKHGVRCDALLGTDFVERTKEEERRKAAMGDWTESRQDFDELWPSAESKDDDLPWPITEEEKEFERMINFGYESMRECEQEQIFDKAMELHHNQRARSRNIYAACMWYAKKLEAAELQDNYEIADKNPIPTFIRAMYTLEEEFDELNSKQYDVELKLQEQNRAIEEAEYREFLRGTVVTMPTKPGHPYHEIFNPVKEEAEEEEMPDLNIDVYLYGILPNAKTDKGLPVKKKKDPDAFLSELIFKEDEID